MQLEIIILSEIHQKTNTVCYHFMWNLKYDTVEPIYETETRITNVENRLVVAKGVWGRRRRIKNARGLSWRSSVKTLHFQCRGHWFNIWSGN